MCFDDRRTVRSTMIDDAEESTNQQHNTTSVRTAGTSLQGPASTCWSTSPRYGVIRTACYKRFFEGTIGNTEDQDIVDANK